MGHFLLVRFFALVLALSDFVLALFLHNSLFLFLFSQSIFLYDSLLLFFSCTFFLYNSMFLLSQTFFFITHCNCKCSLRNSLLLIFQAYLSLNPSITRSVSHISKVFHAFVAHILRTYRVYIIRQTITCKQVCGVSRSHLTKRAISLWIDN